MADGAKPTQPEPLNIAPNEMLGVVSRNLLELNSYISQGPAVVEASVIQAYLERAWTWGSKYKEWRDAALAAQAAQEAKDGKAPAKKAG